MADVCAMNCDACTRPMCTGARALREESSKVLKCESSKVGELETCERLRAEAGELKADGEESSKVLKCESSKVEELEMAERKRRDRRCGLVLAYAVFLAAVSPAAVAAGRAWPWMAHVYDLAFVALIGVAVFMVGMEMGKRVRGSSKVREF